MARKTPIVIYYLDTAGQYRWALRGKNNEIVADSGEGYVTKANAKRAYTRMKKIAAEAQPVE